MPFSRRRLRLCAKRRLPSMTMATCFGRGPPDRITAATPARNHPATSGNQRRANLPRHPPPPPPPPPPPRGGGDVGEGVSISRQRLEGIGTVTGREGGCVEEVRCRQLTRKTRDARDGESSMPSMSSLYTLSVASDTHARRRGREVSSVSAPLSLRTETTKESACLHSAVVCALWKMRQDPSLPLFFIPLALSASPFQHNCRIGRGPAGG